MNRKAKAFGDRIASCLAKFAQVETRSNERGQRLGLETRSPNEAALADIASGKPQRD